MDDSSLALQFPSVGRREVVARFDGGDLTSDAGLLLVCAADRQIGLTEALAAAVRDRRDPRRVRHSVRDLIGERVFAIAAGYEDGNDLNALRDDPGLKVACGQLPASADVLGSQPTISRLENGVSRKDLYRMAMALAERVIAQLPASTHSVVIDVDATDDPCHGQQQFQQFNAHYDSHCYLPLLVYVTGPDRVQRLAASVLRPGCASYKVGLFGTLRRVVRLLRQRFAHLRIILRADSGFGNAEVLAFCEKHDLRYVVGLGGNPRLWTLSTPIQMDTAIKHSLLGDERFEYGEFDYKAGPWPRKRRVVVKAEVTMDRVNPRYVVTDLPGKPEAIYKYYCARGDRENRIKEYKLDLASGRTSCHRFLANQCRLLWHLAANVLMVALQEAARGTRWAKAQVGTLRLRLMKVAARVMQSYRRIVFHLPTHYVDRQTWQHVYRHLCPQA